MFESLSGKFCKRIISGFLQGLWNRPHWKWFLLRLAVCSMEQTIVTRRPWYVWQFGHPKAPWGMRLDGAMSNKKYFENHNVWPIGQFQNLSQLRVVLGFHIVQWMRVCFFMGRSSFTRISIVKILVPETTFSKTNMVDSDCCAVTCVYHPEDENPWVSCLEV